MTKLEILAQIVGIIAMAFNILSYQAKTPKKVITLQLIGSSLFCINYFLLGAIVGSIMNLIGAIRAIVFMHKEKFRADHIAWLIGFCAVYFISYILTFTLFGKEFTPVDGIIELLPVVGMTVSTIGYRLQSAKIIRLLGLIASPSWLVYNIVNGAIGAIICEVLSLCSIVIGLFRYDFKKKSNTKPTH